MPGKSRRAHRLSRGKRRKLRQTSIVVQRQEAAQTHEPAVAPPKVSAPPAKVPVPTTAPYPYITTELRRIGILAGIMLVILVVIALVLS